MREQECILQTLQATIAQTVMAKTESQFRTSIPFNNSTYAVGKLYEPVEKLQYKGKSELNPYVLFKDGKPIAKLRSGEDEFFRIKGGEFPTDHDRKGQYLIFEDGKVVNYKSEKGNSTDGQAIKVAVELGY